MTLDERIVAILKALAKEPSRPVLFMAHEGWMANSTDECALCHGEEVRKRSPHSPMFAHREDCPVREAKRVLHDHGMD